jgi:hypothetical protein
MPSFRPVVVVAPRSWRNRTSSSINCRYGLTSSFFDPNKAAVTGTPRKLVSSPARVRSTSDIRTSSSIPRSGSPPSELCHRITASTASCGTSDRHPLSVRKMRLATGDRLA